jgi:hypothetical protein
MKKNFEILPEKLLKEADELLKKGDLVQASEKYYKAAEEAIKILVNSLNMEEAKLLKEKGDLNPKELENAVYHVYRKIQDEKILNYWASAIAIITVNLDSEIISDLSNDIKELVKIAKRYNLTLKKS